MTRTLTFAPGDGLRFNLFVNLFIAGGNSLHFEPGRGPSARSRDDRAKEAHVIKQWKAISREVNDQGHRLMLDAGGTMTFDQKTFELVVRYLIAAPAGTQESDLVDALIDWVSAAPTIGA